MKTQFRVAVVNREPVRDPARSLRRRRYGEASTAWSYVLPSVAIILGLGIVPMVWSLVLSLQSSDLITPAQWVGLKNYETLSHDPNFRAAVGHTLIYTALFVPLSIAGGLGLALLLNRKVRLIGLYRTLVFVPFVVSATAQGVLFSFIFDSHFGLANAVLHWFDIPAQGFFADKSQALYLLVLIALWSGVGFCVVVYLAGLQDIPAELVEAASIDGAGRGATFRFVVWPALRPMTVFLLIWETLQSLQVFDMVFVTTRGGPLESTTVVVFFVWQQAFEVFNAGYAAAGAYVLAFGLLVLSIGIRLIRRGDERKVSRR
ncbi:carbohydrate ABC transporter permease [Rugosimonospora africana]|uniref:ABC transporter permease n=1 Tax=Rugosimonospora africana TaxID=556532 RepID=A0A8J3QSP7_9ACTN|nr:sugar ABC transporter permease [Rugosimonospora africana]GIH16174.1 ABC transporter permease [Rugosimonospora africana]